MGFVATQAKLLWSCNLGGGAFVEGTPVIGEDGTVYLTVEANLCAVTPPGAAPAAVKWTSTTEVSLLTVGADGDIYCGSHGANPGESYYRLDSTDGSAVWGAPVSAGSGTHFTASGPGIGADGTLYVSGSDGVLRAINPGGTVKWTLAVGNWLDGGPALGSDGRIYVAGVDTSDAAALFAVADETTAASVKWTHVLPVVDGKTPIEAGSVVMGGNGQVYVAARDDENYGLFYSVIPSDTTATQVYGCLTPIESFRFAVSQNMVAENGTLYSSFLALDAISPAGGLLWSTKLHTERRPVVLGDGTIVVTLTDGRVIGFSPGTNHSSGQPAGTPIWQFQAGSHTSELAVQSDGTMAGTVIYFGSADGFLYAISPVPADVPCVVAAPSEITFNGSASTGSTAAEPIRITNAGSGTLKWDITFEDIGSNPITWLSAAQATGTCAAGEWNETTVSVNILASGANPGDTLEAYVDGTYDASGNGESFPLALMGQSIIGNAADPSAVVIDAETGARAFDMSSGLVRGVRIQNSVAPSPGPIEQELDMHLPLVPPQHLAECVACLGKGGWRKRKFSPRPLAP
ncbi:MAG: outer membrane protein assembly factor BamB family protein, partial [Planctomycetota bacterium]